MVRSRRKNFSKTLKDYLVPLIGLLIIIIVIINSFSGSDNNDNQLNNENAIGIEATLGSDDSDAYIVYPGDSNKKIEGEITFYSGEKILVKEGIVSLSFIPGTKLELNRLGELKYEKEGELSLFSSDLWVNTSSPLVVDMRYAKVNIMPDSVLSLSQNEVGSTVYLLNGTVEVSSLAGKSTMLTGGQKLTVSRDNASKEDFDIKIAKEDIDNFFKSSDWFIRNSGDKYLVEGLENEDPKTSTGVILSNSKNVISITSFKDEERVGNNTIDIEGKYLKDEVSIITVNGKTTNIDTENKTFYLKDFALEDSINDLVFKVFDTDRNLIWKGIYTLYRDSTSSTISNSSGFKVKTFDIDASNFKFTAPETTGKYVTYETFVTIRGSVPASTVSKVLVNDYELSSFNGTTWRYHARTDYNNLKDGTNVYEIKYYGLDGSLIYTNYYTIVKKTLESKVEKTISNEA